jgi:hypothetical protein
MLHHEHLVSVVRAIRAFRCTRRCEVLLRGYRGIFNCVGADEDSLIMLAAEPASVRGKQAMTGR